jgi:hypothetical protein
MRRFNTRAAFHTHMTGDRGEEKDFPLPPCPLTPIPPPSQAAGKGALRSKARRRRLGASLRLQPSLLRHAARGWMMRDDTRAALHALRTQDSLKRRL